jgi:hypothetical protein
VQVKVGRGVLYLEPKKSLIKLAYIYVYIYIHEYIDTVIDLGYLNEALNTTMNSELLFNIILINVYKF